MNTSKDTILIEAKDLNRVFTKGNNEVHALKEASFQIEKGTFVSIVGKSGSGKSTLLNLLGGLDTPTSGTLIYDGTEVSSMNKNQLSEYRRHAVGMVFQSFNLIKSLDAISNVDLALTFGRYPVNKRKERSTKLLTNLGLSERMDHKPSELSGGESQRVAIARALANHPNLLLADEPTGNLDSNTSEEILSIIQKLNKEEGVTVIIVTHDMEIAEAYSNQIIRLADGEIIENRKLKS